MVAAGARAGLGTKAWVCDRGVGVWTGRVDRVCATAAPPIARAATPAAASKAVRIKPTPLSKSKTTGPLEPREDRRRRIRDGPEPEGSVDHPAQAEPGHAPIQQCERDPPPIRRLPDDRLRQIFHRAVDQAEIIRRRLPPAGL